MWHEQSVDVLSLNSGPLHFLLLGGDDHLGEEIRLALRSNQPLGRLERVGSGDEALRRASLGNGCRKPQIDLLFLDLDSLGVEGLEFVRQIKQHEDLRVIPVVVLSGSVGLFEREAVYASRANSLIIKPKDPASLRQMLEVITSYWSLWNRPPVCDLV